VLSQVAQDRIRHNANETLRGLSRGMWEIELREDDSGSELEILARDLRQPGGPVRAFEYLSGGEKFRVAASASRSAAAMDRVLAPPVGLRVKGFRLGLWRTSGSSRAAAPRSWRSCAGLWRASGHPQ